MKEQQIYQLMLAKGGSKLTEAATPEEKPGLAGKYDWKLEWTPDAAISAPGSDTPPSVDGVAPTIFTAVQQQLGLKLETARGPVETRVIDRVERPSEN